MSVTPPFADEPALVSVIIPCYNQARFLGESIASVLAQTYPRIEVIVVDDGSRDHTAEVVARFAGVRLIRQTNHGLSAARNAGLRESTGSTLVFLDADDRLLPRALEIGMRYLSAHPNCAFVAGRHRHIAADGSLVSASRGIDVELDHPPEMLRRSYTVLLRRNIVGMHAAVMYRRTVFDAVAGFDTSLKAAEDYDLYLRIARNFPILLHREEVAEYRQHDASMSHDPELMLNSVLAVLRSQRRYVEGDRQLEEAYEAGVRSFKDLYGGQLLHQVWTHVKTGRDWRRAVRGALIVLRHHPHGVMTHVARRLRAIIRRHGPCM